MTRPSVDELVSALELTPHPEGGFYRETYRSALVLPAGAIGPGFSGDRAASTAIHFLVTRGSFSALHRIASDEVWHFHLGAPLTIVTISPDGTRRDRRLGVDVARGESPQVVVPAGVWFGARIDVDGAAAPPYSLVGCTVSPGFDFADFELADRATLQRLFPAHAALVEELTRA